MNCVAVRPLVATRCQPVGRLKVYTRAELVSDSESAADDSVTAGVTLEWCFGVCATPYPQSWPA